MTMASTACWLLLVATCAWAQPQSPLPLPEFSENTRTVFSPAYGYYFTAPYDINIQSLQVVFDLAFGSLYQYVEVLRFTTKPTATLSSTGFTKIFRNSGEYDAGTPVPTNIVVRANDTIGIFGCLGPANAWLYANPPAYFGLGATGAFNSSIDSASFPITALVTSGSMLLSEVNTQKVAISAAPLDQIALVTIQYYSLPMITPSSRFRTTNDPTPLQLDGRGFSPTLSQNLFNFTNTGGGFVSCRLLNSTFGSIFCQLNNSALNPGYLSATVKSYNNWSPAPVQVAIVVVPPVVTASSVPPSIPPWATQVMIYGSNFGTNMGDNTVTLVSESGGSPACLSVVPLSSTTLRCVLNGSNPLPYGRLSATVFYFFGSSGVPVQIANVTDFPIIFPSVQPQTTNHTTLLINGVYFGVIRSAANVTLTSSSAQAISCVSLVSQDGGHALCTLKIPAPLGNVTAVITQIDGFTSLAAQVGRIVAVPTINASTALYQSNGTKFTIVGANFLGTVADTIVTLFAIDSPQNSTCVVTGVSSTAVNCTLSGLLPGRLFAQLSFTGVLSGVTPGFVQVATIFDQYPEVALNASLQTTNVAAIVIRGRFFSNFSGGNSVALTTSAGARSCLSITFTSDMELTCIAATPVPVGNVSAVVTSHLGAASKSVLVAQVVAVPTITTSSALLQLGSPVLLTISGSGFNGDKFDTTVALSSPNAAVNATCTVLGVSATQVNCSVQNLTPGTSLWALANFGRITGGTSNSGSWVQVATVFDFYPVVNANTQRQVRTYPTLSLTGAFFANWTGGNNITLTSTGGGTPKCTSVAVVSTAELLCTLNTPMPVGNLTAVVTTYPGQQSPNTLVAQVLAVPAITLNASLLQSSSNRLIIGGSGFSGTPADTFVTMLTNGPGTNATCTVLSVATTQIVCAITDLTAGLLYASVNFTSVLGGFTTSMTQVATVFDEYPVVLPSTQLQVPTILNVSISGRFFFNYTGGNTVSIMSNAVSVPCSSLVVVSDTQLVCKFAAAVPVGNLTAVVTNFWGASSQRIQIGQVVAAPVITATTAFWVSSSDVFTIRGTSFYGSPANTFVTLTSTGTPNAVCTVVAVSLTSINCTVANPSNGRMDASIVLGSVIGGLTAGSSQVAIVIDSYPVVYSAVRRQVQTVKQVVITGDHFTDPAVGSNMVSLVNSLGTAIPCTGLPEVSTTRIVCTVAPPLAVAYVSAVVSNYLGAPSQRVNVTQVVALPQIKSSLALWTVNASGDNYLDIEAQPSTPFYGTPADTFVSLYSPASGVNATCVATAVTLTKVTCRVTNATIGAMYAWINFTAIEDGVTASAAVATVLDHYPILTPSLAYQVVNVSYVVLRGSYFALYADGNNVTMSSNGVKVTCLNQQPLSSSALNCTLPVPVPVGNLTATVTNILGASSATVVVARIVPVPLVQSSMLAWQSNSTSLVINGTGFVGTPADVRVSFSSAAANATCTVLAVTPTQITCKMSQTVEGMLRASVELLSVQGGVTGDPLSIAYVYDQPPVITPRALVAVPQLQVSTVAWVEIYGAHFVDAPNGQNITLKSGNRTLICNGTSVDSTQVRNLRLPVPR
eukprot:TRINITY_DN3842_c0_g1_i3.p1 TRINITY_DN3842_c0_g1~~TRINITY_DN3842_c0_g1_i3.p1  ORF type:complete len:1581 (-),score=712.16 TRINITY_DN3842_c0_g1_i3:79-4821(-)